MKITEDSKQKIDFRLQQLDYCQMPAVLLCIVTIAFWRQTGALIQPRASSPLHVNKTSTIVITLDCTPVLYCSKLTLHTRIIFVNIIQVLGLMSVIVRTIILGIAKPPQNKRFVIVSLCFFRFPFYVRLIAFIIDYHQRLQTLAKSLIFLGFSYE